VTLDSPEIPSTFLSGRIGLPLKAVLTRKLLQSGLLFPADLKRFKQVLSLPGVIHFCWLIDHHLACMSSRLAIPDSVPPWVPSQHPDGLTAMKLAEASD